jgi:hypothetical protein
VDLERLKLFGLARRLAPHGRARQFVDQRLADQRRADERQPDHPGDKLFAQLEELDSAPADHGEQRQRNTGHHEQGQCVEPAVPRKLDQTPCDRWRRRCEQRADLAERGFGVIVDHERQNEIDQRLDEDVDAVLFEIDGYAGDQPWFRLQPSPPCRSGGT